MDQERRGFDQDLKNLLNKVIHKHYSFMKCDTELGMLDNDDNKWTRKANLSKQFQAEYEAARKEFEAKLEERLR